MYQSRTSCIAWILQSIVAVSLFISASGEASAQTTFTWTGATPTWETAANWGGAGFPQNASDTANFGPTGNTTPTISTFITAGNLTFLAGAQAYTVQVTAGSLDLAGTGIVNNSAVTQNFSVSSVAALNFDNNSNVSGSSPVIISNSGTVTFHQTANANGATINMSNGTLDITGATSTVSIGTLGGSGSMLLGSGQLAVGGLNQNSTVSATISGSGGALIKTGTGQLILSGNNTYSGGTTISGGILQVTGNNNALGTGDATVQSGGELFLNNTITLANNITLSGTGATANSGAIGSGGAGITTQTINGTVSLAGNALVNNNGSNTQLNLNAINLGSSTLTVGGGSTSGIFFLKGNISGNGGLVINNNSSVFLSGGQNSFTGTTDVLVAQLFLTDTVGAAISGSLTIENGGYVEDDRSNQLSANTVLTLNGSGKFGFSYQGTPQSETIAGLSGTSSTSNVTASSAGGDPGLATLTLSGTGFYSYAGKITDSLDPMQDTLTLIKTGSGTQVLSGNNTYMGGTQLNGGTLSVSADNNLGDVSGALTFNGGTLETTASFSTARGVSLTGTGTFQTDTGILTLSTPIADVGGLVKTGSGTLMLSGTNTYSGGTTINGGILQVATDVNLGNASGSVTLNGGTLEADNNNPNFITHRTINLTGTGGTIATVGNVTMILDGLITGSGTLILDNTAQTAGLIALNGTVDNNFTGLTTIEGGTVVLNRVGHIALSGDVLINAATMVDLDASEQISSTGTVTNNGTFQFDGPTGTQQTIGTLLGNGKFTAGLPVANTLKVGAGNFTGTIVNGTGTIALVKTGSGTLTLSGTNTYSGGTMINGGTLQALGKNSLGNASSPFTLNGGTLQADANVQIGGLVTLGANGGLLNADAGHSIIITNHITGSGSLTIISTSGGQVDLDNSVDNDYTGLTEVQRGNLSLNASGHIAIAGDVLIDVPGTLQTNFSQEIAATSTVTDNGNFVFSDFTPSTSISQTLGVLLGTGAIDNNQATTTATLTVSSGNFSGKIQETGGQIMLVKQSSGTLILSGTNTYTGGTTISAGTLSLGSGSSIATSSGVNLSGTATFDVSSSGNQTIKDLTGTSLTFVDLSANALALGTANSTTFGGTIMGAGTIIKTGTGTLTLTGTSSYTGRTTVKSGAIVVDGTGAITATSTITLGNVSGDNGALTVQNGGRVTSVNGIIGNGGGSGTATVTGTGSAWNLSAPASQAALNVGENGSGTLVINQGGSVSDSITQIGDQVAGIGAVTVDGAGSILHSAVGVKLGVNGSGTLTLSNGGSLILNSGSAILNIAVNSGSAGTLNFGNYDLTHATTSGTIQASRIIFGSSGGVINFNQTDSLTMSVQIQNGAGSVVQRGTGTTVLTNSNVYTGGTTINGGILKVAAENNIGGVSAGGLTFGGGELLVTGNSTYTQGVTLNNTGTNTLASATGVTATYSGTVTGSGSLTIGDGTNAGTVTFTGTNTYLGGTRISSGTLQLGNGTLNGTVGNGGVTDNGALAFNEGSDITFANAISGAGTVTQNGTSTLTLSGSNTYSGGTNLSNGTIRVSADNNLGSSIGTFTINEFGGTLETTAGFSSARAVVLSASGTFQTDSGTLTLSNNITGNGIVTKTGTGTLLLTGTDTNNGNTLVTQGTMQLSGTGAALTRTNGVIVGGISGQSASFILSDGAQVTAQGTAGGIGIITVTGSGTVWHNLNNFYVGDLGTGTLIVSAGGSVSGGTGSIASGPATGTATVTGTGSSWSTAGLVVANSGTGTLTVSDSGTVTATTKVQVAFSVGSHGTVNLESGGTLVTNQIVAGSGTAALDFDGGILLANGASTDFISNFTGTEVSLLGGGGTINNGGFNITIKAPFTGTGNLAFTGTGTTTLTATSTYSGTTTINSGTLAISGTGALDTTGYNVVVGLGSGSNAAMVVSNGGQIQNDDGYIGQTSGSTGNVTVTDTGSAWNNGGNLYVGYSGTATLTVSNGAKVAVGVPSNSYIGYGAGSTGSVTVDGAGSTWSTYSKLAVGESGNGNLTISNGGMVSDANGYIGELVGSTGTVTVTGTSSLWKNAGPGGDLLFVGYNGMGTLNITNSGSVSSSNVLLGYQGSAGGIVNLDSGGLLTSGEVRYDGGTGGAALNFDGGTLRANVTSGDLIGNFTGTQVSLLSGGGTIDNAGFGITVSSPLSGIGAATFIGAGTTFLTGTSTYRGGTVINGSILQISSEDNIGGISAGGLTFNGGKLLTTSTSTFTEGITLNAGTNTLATNSTTTYAGTISGTGSVAIGDGTNAGTVIFAHANTYSGATTISAGTLIVNGSTLSTGAVSVASGATLGGTGSTGLVTVSGGGNLNLQDGMIGTLTVGVLTAGNGTTASAFSFDINTTGSVTTLDSINDTGTLTLIGAGGTTITIGAFGSSLDAVAGTYTLLTYTGAQVSLADLNLTTTVMGSMTLSLVQSGDTISLLIVPTTTSATYDLGASVGDGRVISGGTTQVTTTITNTGTGTADSIDYNGLSTTGTVSGGLPTSGGPVANNGGTASGTGTLSVGTTTGTIAVDPIVGRVTNTTLTTTATLSGTTTDTVDVVANRVVTATSVALGRVMVNVGVNGTSTLSTTGDDLNFTRVTVGNGGTDANGISTTGTTSTVFDNAAVTSTRTLSGSFSRTGNTSGTFTLVTTGEGLTGESPINVALGYTADAVANRVVTASTVDMGRVMVGVSVSDTSTLSTTGDDADFTRVTVGTTGPDANGISATGGTSPTFNSASVTDTRNVGGAFATAGSVSGTLTLVTTGEGLTGETPINVALAYTADAVNKRVITNGATTDLGVLHNGATVNATSNAFTTTGTLDTTTSVSVAAGSGTADVNGVMLGGGATAFSGTSFSGTRTLGGTIVNATGGTTSGAFSLAVSTLENGGAGLTGEGAYNNVNVAYSAFIYTGQGVWNTNGGGSWGAVSATPANWSANGGTPGLDSNFTVTDSATFGSVLTGGSASVTLDGANPSLNAITFNSGAGSYTIAQGTGGSITLNGGASSATVTDLSGTHTISAPIILATNANVNVANAQQLILSGPISGTGSLIKQNDGVLTLAGANIYSGGTTLAGGTIVLANNQALGTGSLTTVDPTIAYTNGVTISNPINLMGATTLEVDNADSAVQSGVISESGGSQALTKIGNGVLVLSGSNTYTGGTTISGGQLIAANPQAFGLGTFTQTGGTLQTNNVDHIIAFQNNFVQTGGTLVINLNDAPGAATNDQLSVKGTAALGGNLVINYAAGALAPSQTATYAVVTTTGGITTVSSGYTSPTLQAGALQLLISGAVSGNNFDITLSAVQTPFTSLAGTNFTPNQLNVASYFDRFDTTVSSGPVLQLLQALDGLSVNPAALGPAFDQLTPLKFENFASTTAFNNASFQTQQFDNYLANHRGPDGTFVSDVGGIDYSGLAVNNPQVDPNLQSVRSRLVAWSPAPNIGLLSDSGNVLFGGLDMKDAKDILAPGPTNLWNVFVSGNVVLAQDFSNATAGVAGGNSTTGAVTIGADYKVIPNWLVGVAFGYGHTNATLDTIGSNASVNTYSPTVYTSYAKNGWYANGLASYGFTNYNQNRNVAIGAFNGTANSSPGGGQVVGDLDGGYDFHRGPWTFGPTTGLQYVHLNVDGYTETGLPGANLTVNQNNSDSLRSLFGGHVNYTIKTSSLIFTPHLSASWQHEFLDQGRGITSQFNGIGAGSFVVNTPNPGSNSAIADIGLDTQINNALTGFVDYSVQAGQSNYFGQSVQAGFKIGF